METVGSLFDVQLGKMLNRAAKEGIPQFPYLGNSNVQWGRFEFQSMNTMHFNERERDKFALQKGDVLVCEGGEVGRCAIWRAERKNVYYQKALHRLRSRGEIISAFFQAYMEKISGTKLLDDLTTRTSIAHLTREKLTELVIKLPPLQEQQKIAKILSTWDEAIAITEQLLANSEQQKKALMQQLLTGKKRLPGFEGEWFQCKLSEVAQVIVSPVDKKSKVGEKPVRLCNYTDVYYNTWILDDMPFMPATARESEINKYTLEKNDVLITKDSETPGDIAVPALVAEELSGVVCGYHLAILRPNAKRLFGPYLNYLLSMPRTRYYFFSLANGATRFGLSVGAINDAEITLPPVDEQIAIARIIALCDAESDALEKRLNCYKSEKKALMQQLLTGKRRVKIDEAEPATA